MKTPRNHPPAPLTVSVISLGCAKNTVDSEVLMGRLSSASFCLSSDPAEADVIVINTCGFIEDAKRESIAAILDASRYKKEGRLKTLVVGGCLVQRYKEKLREELPEIDLLFGLDDLERLPDLLADPSPKLRPIHAATYVCDASAPRLLSTPAHYAYVKISEGCDLPCSFCVIPSIRGKYRSRSLEDIEREVRGLAARGVKEVCLVAQDSSWYGADRYGQPRLAELLERLSEIEPLVWVRVHYLYPTRVDDRLLEAMGRPRVAPYFDIPLQHASDHVLKAMRRMGDQAKLEEVLGRVRRAFPQAALRSTFIVGFPGERDEDFTELLGFLQDARLDYAGFFPFSPEEGTPAAKLPGQVSEKDKAERLAAAYALQEEIAGEAHQRWVGQRTLAVLETEEDGAWWARTAYQAPEVDGLVRLEGMGKAGRPSPKGGDFLDIEITHALALDLVGRPV